MDALSRRVEDVLGRVLEEKGRVGRDFVDCKRTGQGTGLPVKAPGVNAFSMFSLWNVR